MCSDLLYLQNLTIHCLIPGLKSLVAETGSGVFKFLENLTYSHLTAIPMRRAHRIFFPIIPS